MIRSKRASGGVVCAVCFGIAAAVTCPSAHAAMSLDLRSIESQSDLPLTTEGIWRIDPEEQNPARRRWVLARDLKLVGLKAYKRDGEYRVRAAGIEARATLYFRPTGPWYRPMAEFPCGATPDPRFATAAGAREAGEAASRAWDELVRREKLRLEVELGEVAGEFPETAIRTATDLFSNWRKALDRQYRKSILQDALAGEWTTYLSLARFQGVCPRKPKAPVLPPWEKLMEPPQPNPPAVTSLLARAPARRWDGSFSVRLGIYFGGKELNGQFLIDTGADRSIISPDFLNGQGVLPVWIEVPHAPPVEARWTGGSGLGHEGRVELVKISGYPLPIHDFILRETDFYEPPETAASCCDGIIGNDVLSHFVLQFVPGTFSEVRLWPADGFSLGEDTPWVATGINDDSRVVSACSATPASGAGHKSLAGVEWDLGDEDALTLHVPWKDLLRTSPLWNVTCAGGSRRIVSNVRGSLPDSDPEAGYAEKDPAVSVGMPVLGRGSFTLDLPHGRIWFAADSLGSSVRTDRSGVVLNYVMIKGERVLRVVQLRAHTPAEQLSRAGLKPGMTVTKINQRDADELDDWQVERWLAGDRGKQVEFEWERKPHSERFQKATLKLP